MKKPIALVYWLIIITVIMMVGIVGFIVTEGYNLLDAVYMTVITIATIGYHEVRPLSTAGKVFNIAYIVSSIAVFTYALSRLTQSIVNGDLALYFKNRKIMHAIDKVDNHVIICGFGRNGQQAAEILIQQKTAFVVIDNDHTHFTEWLENHANLIYIEGDAMDDETLIKAGIKKAKALLLTLPADADNVFIVLSARWLNPQLKIISRAGQINSINKLKTAGADHVILPDKIGGAHMATLVSKPDVVEFINSLWGDDENSMNIESIAYEVLPAHLREKTILEIMATQPTDVSCIGLKNVSGNFIVNPAPDTVIKPGMRLMVLGTMQGVAKMVNLLNS